MNLLEATSRPKTIVSIRNNVNKAIIARSYYRFGLGVSTQFRLLLLTILTVIQHSFLHEVLILADYLD